MKNKIIPIIITMCILMVGLVSATATINIDADDWITDGDMMYVTGSFTDEAQNATSVNWTISDGTTTFYINTNTTTADFGFNATNVSVSMNVSSFADDLGADAYTVTATFLNSSGAVLGSDTELVGIDNSVPVCSQTTLESNTAYDIKSRSLTLTVTGTDASSATAVFDGNTYSLTESSDVFTRNIGTIPKKTYNTVTITTSDGYNTTSCTVLSKVNFYATGGTNPIIVASPNKIKELVGGMSQETLAIIVLSTIGIFAGGAYLLNKKK